MLDENDPIDSNEESTENVESAPVESTPTTESSENIAPENTETMPEAAPETAPEEATETPAVENSTSFEDTSNPIIDVEPISDSIPTEEINEASPNETTSSSSEADSELGSNEIINPFPANLAPAITSPSITMNTDANGNISPSISNGQIDFVDISSTLQNNTTQNQNSGPQYPIFQRTIITQMGDELLVQKVFLNSSGQEYQLNCISLDGDPEHIQYIHTDGTIYITFDGGLTWQIKTKDSEENEGTSD